MEEVPNIERKKSELASDFYVWKDILVIVLHWQSYVGI